MPNKLDTRNYVSLRSIAKELGQDPSSLRKYAKKRGFEFARFPTPETQGQLTLFLTKKDAEALRKMKRGIGVGVVARESVISDPNSSGYFYVIQPTPDIDPNRVKLGYSSSPESRLSDYRTLCPTVALYRTWPCKSAWERAAMHSVTKVGCKPLGGEVFQCDDLKRLVERCNAFFAMM